MLLRNLLLAVLFLSLISTLLIGCVAWYGHTTLQTLEEEEKPVSDLIHSVTMIRNLQFDYLVSQEKRSLDQWDIVYASALNQSERLIYDDPASQARVMRIQRSLITMKTLFDTTSPDSLENLTDRSGGQHKQYSLRYQILNQQSLNAIDELSQMESGITKKKENIQQWIDLVSLVTFTLVPLITFLSLLFLYFRLDRSLSRLEEGTKILGSGNLEHRISITGNDEFVTLARSFNQMIEDLHKVLISRDLLREEKLKAEAANRSKSVFLANISHELRTPLNAILGFSLLLSKDPALTQSQVSQLEIINKSGEHLLTIINDVLDMAKIESGRVGVNLQACDLHRLLHGIYRLFSLQASEKGLDFHVDLSRPVPLSILSDEKMVRQILINLVSNAIKFTKKGSVVIQVEVPESIPEIEGDEISHEQEPPGLQFQHTLNHLQSQQGLQFLRVRVKDTGTGILPEDIASIFDPFEQTQLGQRRADGTGLGLSISTKYAELLGGSLSAESSGIEGEGSVFTLTLPWSPVSDESVRDDTCPDTARFVVENAPYIRILIVDDIRENRELLAAYHQHFGIQPRLVSDGEEAVRTCLTWHPHLVWMDIFMPDQNGVEVMHRIRSNTGDDAPVLIAVTASAFDEQRRWYLEQGFDGFLAKPYTEDEVISILKTYLHIETAGDTAEWLASHEPGEAPLSHPDLSAIDADLLDHLKQSTEQGNITQIYHCIQKIREQDPGIADRILAYARSFDYEGILSLLAGRKIP